MGLHDRDYYWEKHKRANKEANLIKNHSQKSNLKYLLFPVFTLVTLWYGTNALLELDRIKNEGSITPQFLKKLKSFANQKQTDLIPCGITLQTDHNGHFRGTLLINNVSMPFMIDTGATQTTIPVNMAIAAGLPFGRTIQKNTAGGQISDRITLINSLKIGNAEIRNLEASINQHLDEVLIGMNTLKYFHMTQDGNTLMLVAYPTFRENTKIETAPPISSTDRTNYKSSEKPVATPHPNIKAGKLWKKTVSCDEQKNCKTSYSNKRYEIEITE